MMAVRSIARRRLCANSASSSESPSPFASLFRFCFFRSLVTLSDAEEPEEDDEAEPEIDETPEKAQLFVRRRSPRLTYLPPCCPIDRH